MTVIESNSMDKFRRIMIFPPRIYRRMALREKN